MTGKIPRFLALAGVVLGLAPAVAAAQGTTISGQVTGTAGAPVPGASVSIPTLRVGGFTDDQGNYTFTVPASATGTTVTVTARRLGYQPSSAQVTLSGAPVLQNFSLSAAATQLQGVVVTALGREVEKSRLGTAQQQIASTELNTTRAQNVVQQIQGKVSGVQITAPGTQGGSTNIIIRGQNSITGNNQPLFIVDGVAVSNANRGGAPFVGSNTNFDYGNALSDLNPDDIASLSVLKGPNAAAIYGSRAANGVILITTRKGGNTGGRMRTDINTNLTFESPAILPKFQNLYGQGSGGEFQWVDGNYGGINDGVDESWGPRLDGRLICQFDSPGAGTSFIDANGDFQIGGCTPTPWIAQPDNVKDFFRTGVTASTTVGVSGGTERLSGRLSMGADNVTGIFPNNLFQRRTAALNGTFRASSRMSADGSVQYIHNSGRNRPGVGYSGRNPLQSMFNWYGRQVNTESLKQFARGGPTNGGPSNREYNWNYSYHNNPFWVMEENPQLDDRDRLIGSVALNYQLADGLNASLRTGSDIYRLGIQQLYAQGAQEFINQGYAGGFRFVNDYRNDNNTGLTVTAARRLASWLDLDAVAGGSIRREYFSGNSQQTTGLVVPKVYNPSNAAVSPSIDQQVVRRQVQGIYGSAAFTINDWWTVEGTARNDWSSTLPVGANSYFYPSINTSVLVTDAIPGLKGSILSTLKLRAAAARVGSDAPVYSLVPVFLGEAQRFGTQPQYRLDTRLANANLKPEITRSDEVGAELSLFQDRVILDASAYSKSTRNQIFDVEISGASGFDRKWVNAGEISNKGLEALLTFNVLQSPTGLGWTSTFNFARNRSKVVELAPDVETIVLGTGGFGDVIVEARVGEPYGAIRGYRQRRDEAGNLLVSSTGRPLRETTLSVIGNIQPKWTGGWANQLSVGNLSLNTLLDVRKGGNLYSVTNLFGDYAGVLESSLLGRETDWDSPGVLVEGLLLDGSANTRRITAEQYFHSLFRHTEKYVYDAGYVKLREVRVSYNLPEAWANRIMGAREASFALTGRNLKMWTNVPNIDPEFAYSSRNDQGIEVNMSPNPRSIGFNLRIVP
ncbi:MAG TPA: SusC/RagA family TonB-linked outer membrane protein [Gemmatimonadaceae bacterium]|nr:SusC/RagA family TonB-linked outer membrane protein [Gemmatimonadaceae bacterium]